LARYYKILDLKLKWAIDIEQASIDYKSQIEWHKLNCCTFLVEMVEEIIFIQKQVDKQPQSQFKGIQEFRKFLHKCGDSTIDRLLKETMQCVRACDD
jgi:hypothetical protein